MATAVSSGQNCGVIAHGSIWLWLINPTGDGGPIIPAWKRVNSQHIQALDGCLMAWWKRGNGPLMRRDRRHIDPARRSGSSGESRQRRRAVRNKRSRPFPLPAGGASKWMPPREFRARVSFHGGGSLRPRGSPAGGGVSRTAQRGMGSPFVRAHILNTP